LSFAFDIFLSGTDFIIGKSRYPLSTYGFGLISANGVIRGVSGYAADATDFYNNLTYDISDRVGEWTHVAVSFSDASNLGRLYINGELKDSYTSSQMSLTATSYSFSIGAAVRSADQFYYFDGLIDETKVWNYELTPEEIKKEYNGGFSSYFK